MHFPTRDDIDAGSLLFEDGRLHGAKLRVNEVAFGELAERDQPIQSLVPSRHAVRTDHCRRICGIVRHPSPQPL